jgi:hypothetical protein
MNKSVMASSSKIEWTDQTRNPVTGCTKISPGCKHCYADVSPATLYRYIPRRANREYSRSLKRRSITITQAEVPCSLLSGLRGCMQLSEAAAALGAQSSAAPPFGRHR